MLLGHPVAHSLSPTFQNAALRFERLPLTYEAVDVPAERLASEVMALRAAYGAGNATIPHKVALRQLCDRVTPLANRVGAVNTFWVENELLYGDNTDVGGFDNAVRRIVQPWRGMRVALIGAGGAAAAVAAATEQWPDTSLLLWNRSPMRASVLAQHFAHARTITTLADAVRDADLVVNATSVGLTDNALPFDLALLRRDTVVFDLVYRSGETQLVRAARAAGHAAADGLGMLIEQGALAFERWFGFAPDREIMWQAVRERTPHPEKSTGPSSE